VSNIWVIIENLTNIVGRSCSGVNWDPAPWIWPKTLDRIHRSQRRRYRDRNL